ERVTGEGTLHLPVVAGEAAVGLAALDRPRRRAVPDGQAARGHPRAKLDARPGEAGGGDPRVHELLHDRMIGTRHQAMPRAMRRSGVHTSGGGGTSERPLTASTMEPGAGQYMRHAVQPG